MFKKNVLARKILISEEFDINLPEIETESQDHMKESVKNKIDWSKATPNNLRSQKSKVLIPGMSYYANNNVNKTPVQENILFFR